MSEREPAHEVELVSEVSGPTRIFALTLLFCSGVSAAIIAGAAVRMLALGFGATLPAMLSPAVALGAAALGSWFSGRLVDRPGARGLRIFGLLAIALGLGALALPAVVASFSILAWIVPSAAVGGMLPALARFSARPGRSGSSAGWLGGALGLGAAVGVAVGRFVLIASWGVAGTLRFAALASVALGLLGLVAGSISRPRSAERAPALVTAPVRVVAWISALSGFAAVALLVMWTRSLTYFLTGDVWALGSILTIFLVGLGLGSACAAPLAARFGRPLVALGALHGIAGLCAGSSVALLGWLRDGARAGSPEVASILAHVAPGLALSAALILVPAFFVGATFPVASRVYVEAGGAVGRGLGALVAGHAAGAMVGSLAVAFLVIPWLGLVRGILVVGSLYLLGAATLLVVACEGARARRRVIAASALALVVVMNAAIPSGAVITKSSHFEPAGEARLVYVREAAVGSLAVHDAGEGTPRRLTIDGWVTADDGYQDGQVQRMMAHLPMSLHPDPKRVLVVGFGTGLTAHGCSLYDVERIDVVETLPAERRAGTYFEALNHGVASDERLAFGAADGRYDVVSVHAPHPWFGVSLHTRDFYKSCRERMNEDGILSVRLSQDALAAFEWRGLVGSIVGVFPHTSLWYGSPEHYCLIASKQPLSPDFMAWSQRMARPEVLADLAASSFDDPRVLGSRFLLGTNAMWSYVAGATVNTDDLPIVAFSRGGGGAGFGIAVDLIDRKEPALSFFRAGEAHVRDGLAAFDASATWVMRSRAELRYQGSEGAALLRGEVMMKRALFEAPANEDARNDLRISRRNKDQVAVALRDDPRNSEALLAMARILLQEGRSEEAHQALTRAMGLPNAPALGAFYLGLTRYFRGEMPGAIEALGALQIPADKAPRLAALQRYALGSALVALGRSEEGEPLRQSVLASAPAVAEWFAVMALQIEATSNRP